MPAFTIFRSFLHFVCLASELSRRHAWQTNHRCRRFASSWYPLILAFIQSSSFSMAVCQMVTNARNLLAPRGQNWKELGKKSKNCKIGESTNPDMASFSRTYFTRIFVKNDSNLPDLELVLAFCKFSSEFFSRKKHEEFHYFSYKLYWLILGICASSSLSAHVFEQYFESNFNNKHKCPLNPEQRLSFLFNK